MDPVLRPFRAVPRTLLLLLALAALLLAAAGCGSNDERGGDARIEDAKPAADDGGEAGGDNSNANGGDGPVLAADSACTATSPPASLGMPPDTPELLLASANEWLIENEPSATPLTATGRTYYGCARGTRHAWVTRFSSDETWCDKDIGGWFTAREDDEAWETTAISCTASATEAGGRCERTPAPMRAAWFEPAAAVECGWSRALEVRTGRVGRSRCAGSPGDDRAFVIVGIHGAVSCLEAVRVWAAFAETGGGGTQPSGWTCFIAHDDARRLGSCGKDGSSGDVSKWPRSFTALASS